MSNKNCPDNTVEYIVKSGDTLFKIAARNNTTIDVLLDLNPELTSNLLIPGISMCVPRNDEKPAKPENRPSEACPIAPPIYNVNDELRCGNGIGYYVKAGDTLYNIANRYNISLYELLNANRNINPYNMQIGDLVCIPIPDRK